MNKLSASSPCSRSSSNAPRSTSRIAGSVGGSTHRIGRSQCPIRLHGRPVSPAGLDRQGADRQIGIPRPAGSTASIRVNRPTHHWSRATAEVRTR